jgi:glutaminyl-peptide cyclotransferase
LTQIKSLRQRLQGRVITLFWLGLLLIMMGCRQPPAPPIIQTVEPTLGAAPLILPTHTPAATPAARSVTYYGYEIVNQFPHDPEAFTQGLVYDDGWLYESTGLYGRSSLRRVDLETGEVDLLLDLPADYFGEGITIWQDRIIQLTWREKTGFIYDKESFDLLGTFSYETEGWGLTHDGQRLIVTDGSAHLYFWDPETLTEIDRVTVVDERGNPVLRLNELAYSEGELYANVWQTDRIVRIDPETGYVTGWIDLSGLLDGVPLTGPIDVLNGVTIDEENGRLFVTGKLWPLVFEIELVEE